MQAEEHPRYKHQQHIKVMQKHLLSNLKLMKQCREFSESFKWLFVTMQMLSPPVLDGQGPILPFICLHT